METTEIELDTTTRREAAGYASNTELPSHLSVTISLGVSALEKSIPDLENLINRSDHALYDAKQSGRNCVRVWKTG
jgi:diguanylate cyclase (GGDEF)-like protein